LRSCARHGHETFAPTGTGEAEDLRRRIHAHADGGEEAWRCLRCGDFVLGPPRRSGLPESAPLVLRGKALRSAVILRVLAVERALRGIILLAAAYAIERFRVDQQAFQAFLDRDLPAFRDLGRRIHLDVDGNAIVRFAERAAKIKGSTLTLVAVLVAIYALIELAEAVGLWLLKRWGEYFTAVATAAFLPLEVHELLDRLTVIRVLAFVVNVAAVVYLLVAKRLFGLRGGGAAYEQERRGMSLLEVEEAAGTAPAPAPDAAATSPPTPPRP
jgi:uncharacterized membrane protein (DUF2068 family)